MTLASAESQAFLSPQEEPHSEEEALIRVAGTAPSQAFLSPQEEPHSEVAEAGVSFAASQEAFSPQDEPHSLVLVAEAGESFAPSHWPQHLSVPQPPQSPEQSLVHSPAGRTSTPAVLPVEAQPVRAAEMARVPIRERMVFMGNLTIMLGVNPTTG